MKTTAQRKRDRKRSRLERLYGPTGFLEFVWSLPCVKCGGHPVRAHHDPTAATGGTWQNVTPLCDDCHTMRSDSRHRHPGGFVAFWSEVGMSREDAAANVQAAWRSSSEGLED